jgi:hypothetical protein
MSHIGQVVVRTLAAIAALLLWHGPAQAQMCCAGAGTDCHLVSTWPACTASGCVSLDASTPATGSGPSSDTSFNPGGFSSSHSFAITGKKLVAINNSDGSILFSITLTPATLDNFPNPVILTIDCTGANCVNSTKITNFIAGDDGLLYKVVSDLSTMPPTVTTASVNLQRPGCTMDKLKGTPAVQLNRFSNAAFQTAMGDTITDLVIVGTFYTDQGGTCPGGQNRVYGLKSTDLSTKWIYNQTGAQVLNEVSEACYLEYYSGATPAGTNNNMAVCGFNKTGTTNGLVALNTATTLAAGMPRWAVDTGGGVIVRPVIATLNGRRAVYVGTNDAFIRAYSPADGSFFWTGGAAMVPNGIAQNFWAEFRGGPLSNRIFVLATDGTFRRFIDNGTSGTEEGPGLVADITGVVKYTSMVVAAPNNGLDMLYIGRNDGKVQQISSAYTQEETQIVGGPNATVFDPTLDIAPDGTVTQLVVTAGADGAIPGKIARFQLPWCTSPTGGIQYGCANPADLACKAATPPSNR